MKNYVMVAVLAFVITSCKDDISGEGGLVGRDFDLAGFKKVELAVPAELHYRQAANFSVKVIAQENVLDALKVSQSGDILTLGIKSGVNLKNFKPIAVHIESPDIAHLGVSGSGHIRSEVPIATGYLSLHISGSGKIDIVELEADFCDAGIDGSGEIHLHGGKATEADLWIAGSGSVLAKDLEVTKAVAAISGSGEMEIFATDELDASISGSGNIRYKGTPATSVSISGSGKVAPFN